MIVTFYSFKGGVGRSMALANVAEILAARGYNVIACDWDLEAPGLERYFTESDEEAAIFHDQAGLLDLIVEYKITLATHQDPAEMARKCTDLPDRYCRLGNVAVQRPTSLLQEVDPAPMRLGSLRILTAGSRADTLLHQYIRNVQEFDWKDFYESWGGNTYLEFLRRDLMGDSDVVLIDSRTGFTELGGVCTYHLADVVVLLAAPNDANLAGVWKVAKVLGTEGLRSDNCPVVLPVAARIEQFSEKEDLTKFRKKFSTAFSELVSPTVGDVKQFLHETEIPYVPFYSFVERVVARESDDTRHPELYQSYNAIADYIVRTGERAELLQSLSESATRLDLSRRQLSEWPKEFRNASNVRVVVLVENSFRAIPPEIFRLQELRYLDLSRNQIAEIDPRVSSLKNLVALVVKPHATQLATARTVLSFESSKIGSSGQRHCGAAAANWPAQTSCRTGPKRQSTYRIAIARWRTCGSPAAQGGGKSIAGCSFTNRPTQRPYRTRPKQQSDHHD